MSAMRGEDGNASSLRRKPATFAIAAAAIATVPVGFPRHFLNSSSIFRRLQQASPRKIGERRRRRLDQGVVEVPEARVRRSLPFVMTVPFSSGGMKRYASGRPLQVRCTKLPKLVSFMNGILPRTHVPYYKYSAKNTSQSHCDLVLQSQLLEDIVFACSKSPRVSFVDRHSSLPGVVKENL